ncbi:MAG: GTPase Era [Xanthomonadales bacterium PRO7]|nr:GTPase Era [Xanthomonadales bacterium PRO7]
MSETNPAGFRCGTTALVGRPNVGKSTLLNAMLGWHLSIAGPKPQTTRHRILGILTRPQGQILFLDTPGMHRGGGRAMNRQLNRTARQAIAEADVAVQIVEAGRWTAEDTQVWNALDGSRPRLIAINKVDAIKDKSALLPFIERIGVERAPDAVYLVSAKRRDGLDDLVNGIISRLPVGAAIFAEDELTDRSERFLAGEMVREQVMLRLGQELPYAATVEVSEFSEADGRATIHATIWVEREGQKAIVIGAGGAQLKAIGSAARRVMEKAFDRRVHLQLWVRVRENWSDDEAALKRFGYTE